HKQAEFFFSKQKTAYEMPESETTFETARKSVLNQIESERITRASILFNYLNAKKRGLDHDIRKDIYDEVPSMTLADVIEFQKKYIKGSDYNTMVLGSRSKLNFNDLKKYGEIREVTLDELFGYEKLERIDMEGAGR